MRSGHGRLLASGLKPALTEATAEGRLAKCTIGAVTAAAPRACQALSGSLTTRAPHVRFALNCGREWRRADIHAMGHVRTHAPQQYRALLDRLVWRRSAAIWRIQTRGRPSARLLWPLPRR